MVDRIPSLHLIHVILPLALCGFPTQPMVSGTFNRSWYIVPFSSAFNAVPAFNHAIGLRMASDTHESRRADAHGVAVLSFLGVASGHRVERSGTVNK